MNGKTVIIKLTECLSLFVGGGGGGTGTLYNALFDAKSVKGGTEPTTDGEDTTTS